MQTTAENRAALVAALDAFKYATEALDHAWSYVDGDAIANYPTFMPSFDEFTASIALMEVRSNV